MASTPLLYTKVKDNVFKIITIGSSGVGKKSLVTRFADDEFNTSDRTTLGIDFKTRIVELENFTTSKCCSCSKDQKEAKLQVWAGVGQGRFETTAISYFESVAGVILCYDITDEKSFDQIRSWLEEVKENVKDAPKILIGNKLDRAEERTIKTESGRALAYELDIPFFETSSKSGLYVDEAFIALAETMWENRLEVYSPTFCERFFNC